MEKVATQPICSCTVRNWLEVHTVCTHLATSFLLTIKLNTMIILTVLDFNDGKVWQYDISTDKELQAEDFEDIMIEQGHDLDDCEWMSHADDTLHIKHIEYYEKH